MQSSTMHDVTTLRIEHAASTLRSAGALDVDVYELKLRQNATSPTQVASLGTCVPQVNIGIKGSLFMNLSSKLPRRERGDSV
jgi:hypothetical protein